MIIYIYIKIFNCSCVFLSLVDLQVVGNDANVTVASGIPNISLSCEMSLYIHPDENLQWFHDGGLINITDMEQYSISISSGNGEGQNGGNVAEPSHVSTLVISEPQMADSGIYTCAIRNTELSQDTELSVVPSKFVINANHHYRVMKN